MSAAVLVPARTDEFVRHRQWYSSTAKRRKEQCAVIVPGHIAAEPEHTAARPSELARLLVTW
jgi:hypothetical protein